MEYSELCQASVWAVVAGLVVGALIALVGVLFGLHGLVIGVIIVLVGVLLGLYVTRREMSERD